MKISSTTIGRYLFISSENFRSFKRCLDIKVYNCVTRIIITSSNFEPAFSKQILLIYDTMETREKTNRKNFCTMFASDIFVDIFKLLSFTVFPARGISVILWVTFSLLSKSSNKNVFVFISRAVNSFCSSWLFAKSDLWFHCLKMVFHGRLSAHYCSET